MCIIDKMGILRGLDPVRTPAVMQLTHMGSVGGRSLGPLHKLQQSGFCVCSSSFGNWALKMLDDGIRLTGFAVW